jgi:hypothetical protein
MFKHFPPGSRPFQIRALRTTLKAFSLLAISAASSAWALPVSTVAPLPDAPDAAVMQQTQASPSSSTDQQTAPATPQTTPKPAQPADNNYSLQGAEHQRILGIIPEFQAVNTAGVYKPLTVGQKFSLMWKSSTDPYIFTLDAIVAGIGQAKNSNPGFGQGAEGYFKRFGASYADTFDGNFWGNAVLTSAFREDPRYFREGESHRPLHRALYSAATAVWCRRDSGNWGPNYANVLGNFISGGISNAYYPAADRGIGKTVTGAVTVTAEGIIGSELEEFWPDIEGHFLKKRREKQLRQSQPSPTPPAAVQQ